MIVLHNLNFEYIPMFLYFELLFIFYYTDFKMLRFVFDQLTRSSFEDKHNTK